MAHIYRKLWLAEEKNVDSDRDIVIRLEASAEGTRARLRLPLEARPSKLMSVGEAVGMARREQRTYPDRTKILVVDEKNLWQNEWGELTRD